MTERVHVCPTGDVVEHELTEDCVCGPDVTFIPGGAVVTHHSLDGRELIEAASSQQKGLK